jgi:hypothetical protein
MDLAIGTQRMSKQSPLFPLRIFTNPNTLNQTDKIFNYSMAGFRPFMGNQSFFGK